MAAGRSDMRPDRLAGEDENLTIWSDTETALFLKIWRRPDVQTALRQYTRKRPIWKKVSAELAAEGYRRSAEQCKSKMHNLMTSYRRVKKGVDPESRCKFFAIIDQVMTSAEFEAVAGPAGCAAEALDLDGETSEESGPSTSGLSDYAHSHSHSVSPGSREDSAADGERARCGPWRPVPVRLAEPAIFQAARERSNDECDQPPRKRYCNWEERYEADLAAARGVTGHPDDAKRELSYMKPMAGGAAAVERPPRPSSPQPLLEDMQVPRDLRVTSRSPPEPPAVMETRDLITARARQLLSVLPAHPQLADRDEPITNGQHRDENGVHALSGDDRTATSLERMETLLQELVDMQRAFLLSEERRRREQLVREENWRMQDKEFLVRLAQTLANSQH